MLNTATVTACLSYIQNMNIFCEQNVEFLNVKPDGTYSNCQAWKGYTSTHRTVLVLGAVLSNSTSINLSLYSIFLLLLLHLRCTTNQMSVPFEYLLQPLVEGNQGHFLFSGESSVFTKDADGPGVFKAEKDGVGDKGSRDTRTVNVQTLL